MRGRALPAGRIWKQYLAVSCLVGVIPVAVGPIRADASEPRLKAGAGACRVAVVEGEVRAGESFERPIGQGLEVRLEALSWGSGWVLRVLPMAAGKRGLPHDYAELATPPYASVNPLIFSTDFSFRSQDVIAWNPRRFRYAANAAEFARLAAKYERYGQATPPTAKAESELEAAVNEAQQGTLEILDARLIPGTANQAGTAAMVASHFSTTAHTIEEQPEGKGSPLGKVTWVRFQINLDLHEGFRPEDGMTLKPRTCP